VSPPLWSLTASQASAALASGETSAEALARACLARIAEREPDLKAWAFIDADAAIRAARELDKQPRRGPLHGVPIAIKDMIDTADMPTGYNSPLFAGHRPSLDAAVVATLRAAGALILGKTETTEFAAAGRQAPTATPADFARTSGGSSAGSAAAVADSHVPLAIGTQTGGSTIRPASFCGAHAMKPTWGLISREGARIYSVTLDTIGLFARSVPDLSMLLAPFLTAPAPVSAPPIGELRIAACLSPDFASLELEGRAAFDDAAWRLARAGARVSQLDLPEEFAGLSRAHRIIMHREGGAAFLPLARQYGEALHEDFRFRVENRDGYSNADLVAAYDLAAKCRVAFDAIASEYDAVLTPSAPGIPPEGRVPGDPVFNRMWTLLHAPVVGLPVWRDGAGRPVGVSLTAPRFHDERLLAVAGVVDEAFASIPPSGVPAA
jgi:Asp-tRNA(Asn)/Glu-tRNA(Gln) amidotransferase A subunit family amidase